MLDGLADLAVLAYPGVDPVLVRFGPFALRWYGLAYVAGLAVAIWLLMRDARRKSLDLSGDDAIELVLWLAVGLFLGARLGFVLAYNPGYYLARPSEIIAVWAGGMSFHGGLVGAILGGGLWGLRRKKPFYPYADILAAAAPVGLLLGRLANFVNGELWGRPSSLPWAMAFPAAGPVPRHPSQIYEAILEGLVIFIVLRVLLSKELPAGTVFWSFIGLYGVFRFLVEFTRQPDPHLGLVLGPFSMGQLLSLPMAIAGVLMVRRLLARPPRPSAPPRRTPMEDV